MNSVLKSPYAWTSAFIEAITKRICDVANVVLESLGITSHSVSESSTSTGPDPSTSTSSITDDINENPVVSGEKVLQSIPQALQEFASYFAFDDFQLLLLEIFIALILIEILLIYIVWNIYGERITERFMTPKNSSEKLKKSSSESKLFKDHSA